LFEEWNEEELEAELPYVVLLPFEDALPLSILAGTGSALTGLGIAQLINKGVVQMLQKALPFLTAKISILSLQVPITSIIGLGLIGLSLFLVWKTREVVIKL